MERRTPAPTRRAASRVPAILEPAAMWMGALIRMTSPHPAMTHILDVMERLQEEPYRTSFMLTGEPGTGKEGLARTLHKLTAPRGRAVHLDVGGLPEREALEVLCGSGKRAGLAEEADGGTLIVEELCALGPGVQLTLLRLLKSGRCERMNGGPVHRLDLRAVALTDRDPVVEMNAGRLRADLFWRVARVVLWLPPLRERPDDIGPSAIWMGNRILRGAGLDFELRPEDQLRHVGPQERREAVSLSRDAVDELRRHTWPGNFRELEAVLERALLLYRRGPSLGAEEIRAALQTPSGPAAPAVR